MPGRPTTTDAGARATQTVEPWPVTLVFVTRRILFGVLLVPVWLMALYWPVALPVVLVSGVLPDGAEGYLIAAGMVIGLVAIAGGYTRELVGDVRSRRRPRPIPVGPGAPVHPTRPPATPPAAVTGRPSRARVTASSRLVQRSQADTLPVVHGTRPIVAHRMWELVAAPGPTPADPIPEIRGAFGVRWPGPSMTAGCRSRFGRAHAAADTPDPDCSCGIYALKRESNGYARGLDVRGAVALSGRVLEGEHGYRAQQATITGSLVLHGQCRRRDDDQPPERTLGHRGGCGRPGTRILLTRGEFDVRCDRHDEPDVPGWTIGEFLAYAGPWIEARYGVALTREGDST